ncbi:hypothetical protein ONS95_014270 [Cadophora gregata]|uniref:uncharacterized protein n=1 Tax=Cadophora gregata TaxID=51156 RepID=UPI0026DA834A|nr:uncharacterized protein ONS95_014270 [Cadophora gregata]KAK0114028.1 hypothetical protein ONS96_014874 [Cadophora gregata f. sp. sojae]KAK0114789.1 hypothetical protein ONS95_014270 [Cadophora gregata]
MLDSKLSRLTSGFGISGLGRGTVRTRRFLYVLLALTTLYLTITTLLNSSGITTSYTYTYNPQYGILAPLPSSPRYAYATLLTSDDERYYTAVRVLAYQLLADPETKTQTRTNLSIPIPFIVMVTSGVPSHQRRQLILDGAQVAHVEDVPLPWWIRQRLRRPSRYGDQFTKLRVLQMLEFDRVLYLDVDTLLMRCLDGIFEDEAARRPMESLIRTRTRSRGRLSLGGGKGEWEPESRSGGESAVKISKEESMVPAQYVFAGRSDNGRSNDGSSGGEYDHPFPPIERDSLSGGFWIVAPSNELFAYYMFVMQSSTLGVLRPFDPQFMEQAMLNYVHRRTRGGSMPWVALDYRWSATFPNERDVEGGVASMHDKFWANGPEVLKERWRRKKEEMERLWPVVKV